MNRILLVLGLFFSGMSFASSPQTFILPTERIEHKMVGDSTIVLLEDFIEHSQERAKIVAMEVIGNVQYYTVERNEKLATLVPGVAYFQLSEQSGVVMFATVNTCQQECTASAVAGAIAGAGAGIAGGAQTGATLCAAGGPVSAGLCAGGGAAIGGGAGLIGGFIGGFETCKIATDCIHTLVPTGGAGGETSGDEEDGAVPKD